MATLTQTAQTTRKALKYGVIALVVIFVLKIAWGVGTDIWKKIHPPPPPPPTMAFGPLPKLKFPEKQTPELSYRLETIQGALPQFDNIDRVYLSPQKPPNLLALDRAKQKVRKMGFTGQPEKVNENTYRWTTEITPATTLEMNINTGNFHLRYQFENDQELLVQKNLPTNEQAAQEAKSFLQNNGLLTEDLATGSAEFDYLKYISPNLIPAISLSEADFVRVNFFRADLNDLRIYPPNPKEALVSFLFSGSRLMGKRIIEIKYTYQPIDRNTSATYPLKPINNAWQELQSKQGYIANLGQNDDKQITIRKIYLAYYDSEEPQTFIQPIYIFEGDHNFFAYVPAIDPTWTEK
ncbi:hypothetical protein A2Z41_01940 [Microgenomates group bacterium RBG_19FT_COMBO_39_10]|nr:MAG: hypothetical protein A2Z41_01940 [Microgenomates group bacterium RBG_19FT_COMBO_39_10]